MAVFHLPECSLSLSTAWISPMIYPFFCKACLSVVSSLLMFCKLIRTDLLVKVFKMSFYWMSSSMKIHVTNSGIFLMYSVVKIADIFCNGYVQKRQVIVLSYFYNWVLCICMQFIVCSMSWGQLSVAVIFSDGWESSLLQWQLTPFS